MTQKNNNEHFFLIKHKFWVLKRNISRRRFFYASKTYVNIRDISGPEYEWAIQMGKWPMSHSTACKNQDFDGPLQILIGHSEKMMG